MPSVSRQGLPACLYMRHVTLSLTSCSLPSSFGCRYPMLESRNRYILGLVARQPGQEVLLKDYFKDEAETTERETQRDFWLQENVAQD